MAFYMELYVENITKDQAYACKHANFVHLVAGAAVEQFLVLIQVSDVKFSSALIAFEAIL